MREESIEQKERSKSEKDTCAHADEGFLAAEELQQRKASL
jgi:hypothetical protein